MPRQHEPDVRSYSVTHPSGTVVPPTGPAWDQLLFASSGVMEVVAGDVRWIVPPHRALWAPAGEPYAIEMRGRVEVRSLYVRSSLRLRDGPWQVLDVSPLVRETLLAAVERSPLWLTDARAARLIGVLFDELRGAGREPIELPRPSDPRAVALADAIVADPAADLDALVETVPASRRTLERLFPADVGMTVAQWRRRVRAVEALRRLTAGASVTQVAADLGYATPSAFTEMFRREVGVAPTAYLARR